MRPFVLLFAGFALLLSFGPWSHIHAAGMGDPMPMMAMEHHVAEGCAQSKTHHGKSKGHDAGDRDKAPCCLGAICVSLSLPATAAAPTPLSAVAVDTPVADALMTGRDVAPPLDPPRPFA